MKSLDVIDIPIRDLPSLNPDFKRDVRPLECRGIASTSQLVTAYLSCELGPVKGLGRKFFALLREFLSNQHKYKALYRKLQNDTGGDTQGTSRN